MTMDPEIKAKWVEALRSGEYEQTTEILHSKKGFCCLGVLLDISKKGRWNPNDSGEYLFDELDEGCVIKCDGDLGLQRELFKISANEERILVAMNDGGTAINSELKELANYTQDPQSFSAIADYIEANL